MAAARGALASPQRLTHRGPVVPTDRGSVPVRARRLAMCVIAASDRVEGTDGGRRARNYGLGMLTPKVICLTTLPSAHGSRSQYGAVSVASSAAKR